MGKCLYCGRGAGFRKDFHQECDATYRDGAKQMVSLCAAAAIGEAALEELLPKLSSVAEKHYVNRETTQEILIVGWERAIDKTLESDLVTEAEETILHDYTFEFGITYDQQERNRSLTRLNRAKVLRELLEGKSVGMSESAHSPFNLDRSEKLVWQFDGAVFLETQGSAQRVGNIEESIYQVANGFYVGSGAFMDRFVPRDQGRYVESGTLGVTTKHLYFVGTENRLRIAYPEILSLGPYSDGISIVRNVISTMSETFVTGDGWFTYNLVYNLSRSVFPY